MCIRDRAKRALYEEWLANPRVKRKFGFQFTSDSVKGNGILKDGDKLIEQTSDDFNGAYVEYAWVQQGSELVPKIKTIYPKNVNPPEID